MDTVLPIALPRIGQQATQNLPEQTPILYHVVLEGLYLTLDAEVARDGQDEHGNCQNDEHQFQGEFHSQHHRL